METNIMWEMPTLFDAIMTGYICTYLSKYPIPGNTNKILYQCDCENWAFPSSFTDVREFENINSDFICDGCYSHMERHLEDVTGIGSNAIDKQDFIQRFLIKANAPQEVLDVAGNRYDENGVIN